MPSINWDSIRQMLNREIEVYYVRNDEVNRQRDSDKVKTINWIIERMQKGAQPGGTRLIAPAFTFTFGNLWEPVRHAIVMAHPFCQCCGGQMTVEVHHIRPRYLRGAEFDPCNLVGLCDECHDEIHRQLENKISLAIMDSIGGIRLV